MSRPPPQPEDTIHLFAARQHGLVTRKQLVDMGLAPYTLDYRVKRGRLRPIHRGVYQIGPLASPRAREMAAVLVCGPGAVVSYRSAASLWGLLPAQSEREPVDVTTSCGGRGVRPGVRIHREDAPASEDRTEIDGVPVTTAARTLVDLAAVVGPRDLERALAHAERKGLLSRFDLEPRVPRLRGRRGASALRALLRPDHELQLTRSEAEERLLALVGRAQLPRPRTNVLLHGYEVDFYWPAERVVVEVDGFAFHSATHRFEADRRRDADLSARGIQVLRVTWRQITGEPEAVLVRIAQTLALARR